MPAARDDPLKRSSNSRPNFLEHVQTTKLKDVGTTDRLQEPAADPAGDEPLTRKGRPRLRPPSIMSALQSNAPVLENGGTDRSSAWIIAGLLLASVVVGAIVGTIVAMNAFP